MQLGRVIGDVVATRKDPGFTGVSLLIVQPVDGGGAATGRPLVAADSVGAGVGELVFFVRGKEAVLPFLPVEVAADAGIVGIVDAVDHAPVRPAVPAEARPAGASGEGGRA